MLKVSIITLATAQLVFPTTDEIVDYVDHSVENMTMFGSSFLPTSVSNGECPTVDAMPSFNLEEFKGVWYQAAISHTSQKRQGGQCVYTDYEWNTKPGMQSTFAIDISQQTGEKKKFDPRTHVAGYARMDDFAHHTGHMEV